MNQTLDITPTPRILRTLGDIPFEAWQCFAELADNALDGFKAAESRGIPIEAPRVDIHWSSETLALSAREIIISDNGLGMTLEQVQQAVRAGYSSNDPIHNLGLFGMGFNISTARLGDETTLLSATEDSTEWVGVRIDFASLIRQGSFQAEIVREPKSEPAERGTKITIRKLKDGVTADLKRKQTQIRRRLEAIYTPILEKNEISIYVQGFRLNPQPHCVWNESRFITRHGEKVPAIIRIDRDLGETFFDVERNRYLNEDEASDWDVKTSLGAAMPTNIVRRARRLTGWVGIQRYFDTSDFGIDFIRNGRKILIADKTLFMTENPETGSIVQEYPVELGSTVGGRIVGEIHVDYLIPTYQKNGFDTSDRAWRMTIDAVRGGGPLLPGRRTSLGIDGSNDSPVGRLVNGYRRTDPGTKHLALSPPLGKEFLKSFRAGVAEFQDDTKWYKAAQEADEKRADGGNQTPANPGKTSSVDPSLFGPSNPLAAPLAGSPSPTISAPATVAAPTHTETDALIKNSTKVESLSKKYQYSSAPGFEVRAWQVKDLQILNSGTRVPSRLVQDGNACDFFFDPSHQILAEYPISPAQLLLMELSERFSLRDTKINAREAYFKLVPLYLGEERILGSILSETAVGIFSSIKEALPAALGHRIQHAMDVVALVPAEEEAMIKEILNQAPGLFDIFQKRETGYESALQFVTNDTVIRLAEEMPEEFLDNKLFQAPYSSISTGSTDAINRLKKSSLDTILAYLKDAAMLVNPGRKFSKHELIRFSQTLLLLQDRLR